MISTEARLVRSSSGGLFSRTRSESYQHWSRYLTVFDEVRVLARVEDAAPERAADAANAANAADVPDAPDAPDAALGQVPAAVTGPGVQVVPMPDFRGVAGYLRARPALRRELAAGLAPGGVLAGTGPADVRYVAYAPGLFSGAVVGALAERGLSYGLELIGDPADVATHLLGPWAGPVAGRVFARRCRRAAAVRYVTRETLQRRYPAAPGAVVADFPEGLLADEDFVAGPRPRRCAPSPVTLLTIGSQEQRYKGHDVLLRAVSMLRAGGRDVHAVVVGDGRHHDSLVASTIRLGLRDVVRFVPGLDREGVNAALDEADLFVLPSLTEGLPRVLIEAMARAVPAVASAVGGVVELLDPADLVPPGDPVALSRRIADVVGSSRRLETMSARNRRAAEAYRAAEVVRRAQDYYLRLAQHPPNVPLQISGSRSSGRVGT